MMSDDDGLTNAEVIAQTTDFVRKYFEDPKFDASHDIQHVLRVRDNALQILEEEQSCRGAANLKELDPLVVHLAALLHDVDDKKYCSPDAVAPEEPRVIRFMKNVAPELAVKLYEIVEGVSYSSEIKDPAKVTQLIERYPELAVVQDADRLDAIGAVGIGRCFTFGGARGTPGMGVAIEHFEDKLLKLESIMKTDAGKAIAAERTRRIREFMTWWKDEGGPTTGRE
jgi:uncharacterized protein